MGCRLSDSLIESKQVVLKPDLSPIFKAEVSVGLKQATAHSVLAEFDGVPLPVGRVEVFAEEVPVVFVGEDLDTLFVELVEESSVAVRSGILGSLVLSISELEELDVAAGDFAAHRAVVLRGSGIILAKVVAPLVHDHRSPGD